MLVDMMYNELIGKRREPRRTSFNCVEITLKGDTVIKDEGKKSEKMFREVCYLKVDGTTWMENK